MKNSIIALVVVCLSASTNSISQITYESNGYNASNIAVAINQSAPVGNTPGSASVTGSGSSSYSIPISVPDGTNGLQPTISIDYSSQSGDGLIGFGWNLGGLSAITRGDKKYFYDDEVGRMENEKTDPYYLDGIRLVHINGDYGQGGSLYETRVVDYSRVTGVDNNATSPVWFRVEKQGGLTLEYGSDASSILHHPDGTKLVWPLNRIIDCSGNYIQFVYQVVDQELLLKEILYTGNTYTGMQPYCAVNFVYEQAHYEDWFYANGNVAYKRKHLLTEININGEGGSIFKTYNFKYVRSHKRSMLKEVVECGATGGCLNPTRFAYGSSGQAFVYESSNISANGSYSTFEVADLNQDGFSDMVRFNFQNQYSQNANIILSSYELLENDPDNPGEFTSVNTVTVGSPSHSTWNQDARKAYTLADFNGDGVSDLLFTPRNYNSSTGDHSITHFNRHISPITSNNYSSQLSYAVSGHNIITPNALSGDYNHIQMGDFDGDSKTDFLTILYNGNQAIPQYNVQVHLAGGVATADRNLTVNHSIDWLDVDDAMLIDYDGDGDSELLVVDGNTSYAYDFDYDDVNNDFTLVEVYNNGFPTEWHEIFTGDFNGDRITDLLTHNGTDWYLAYGTGKTPGLGGAGYSGSPNSLPTLDAPSLNSLIVIGDYNGDGWDDIINRTQSGSSATFSEFEVRTRVGFTPMFGYGDDFYISQTVYGSPIGNDYVMGDFNGDGRVDIIDVPTGTSDLKFNAFRADGRERLLEIVRDGFGKQVDFEYEPLSYGSTTNGFGYYSMGVSSAFPLNKTTAPLYVVHKFWEPDGLEGQIENTYQYLGAAVHRQGIGFIGFDKVTITNDENDLLAYTENGIHLPAMSRYMHKTGVVDMAGDITFFSLSSGQVINEMVYDYDWDIFNSNTHHHGVNVWKTQKVNYLNDSRTEKEMIYTNDGTVVESHEKIGLPATGSGTPIMTIDVNVEGYHMSCNGLSALVPVMTTTTTTRNGMPAHAVTNCTDYDVANGRLNWTKEYCGVGAELTTEYLTYNLGSPTTIRISANNVSPRETSYTYDSKGRWVVSVTNPLGQSPPQPKQFHPLWGKPTVSYTMSGLSSSYQYDEFGRLMSETNPIGVVKSSTYSWSVGTGTGTSTTTADNSIYTVQVTKPGKPTVVQYFDRHAQLRMNQVKSFNGSDWISTVTRYDQRGRVETTTTPFIGTSNIVYSSNQYDDLGRIKQVDVTGIGSTTREYTYAPQQTVTKITDPQSVEKFKYVDASGLTVKSEDDGGVITYTYNSQSKPISVQVGGQVVANMAYDLKGRKVELNDLSGGGVTAYQYNPYDELIMQATSAGTFMTTFEYDALGRIIEREGQEGTMTYSYVDFGNGLNRIEQISGLGETKTFTYDNFDRVEVIDFPTQSVSQTHQYDSYSRLSSRTINTDMDMGAPDDMTFNYNYNSTGYLDEVSAQATNESNPTIIFAGTSKNAFDKFTQFTLCNGVNTNNVYNNYGAQTTCFASGTFGYFFDWNQNTGNLDGRDNTNLGLSEGFTYDNLNRLETAIMNSSTTLSMSVNNPGNITNRSDVGNLDYGSSQYQVGMAVNSPQNIATQNQNLSYTPFNEPMHVQENQFEMSFDYGTDYTRIKSTISYPAGNPIEERTYFPSIGYETVYKIPSGIKYYLFYENIDGKTMALTVKEKDVNTGIYSGAGVGYHAVYTDHIGSILKITDQSSATVALQSFDASGRYRNPADWTYTTSSFTNPDWLIRGYSGHEQLDLFSLIHMNGRLYAPLLGRMLSPDNFVQDPVNSQSFNRYSYAMNNPLRYSDPTGELNVAWNQWSWGKQWNNTLGVGYSNRQPVDNLAGHFGFSSAKQMYGYMLAAQGITTASVLGSFYVGANVTAAAPGAAVPMVIGAMSGGLSAGTGTFMMYTGSHLLRGNSVVNSAIYGLDKSGKVMLGAAGIGALSAGIRYLGMGLNPITGWPIKSNSVTYDFVYKHQEIQVRLSETDLSESLQLSELSPIQSSSEMYFDGETLYWIDNDQYGTQTLRGYIQGESGPHGNGALPNGDYHGHNYRSRTNAAMTRDGVGWSIDLDPQFETTRTYLEIHPDGNVAGTQGCIGLQAGSVELNQFGNWGRHYLQFNNYIDVNVFIP